MKRRRLWDADTIRFVHCCHLTSAYSVSLPTGVNAGAKMHGLAGVLTENSIRAGVRIAISLFLLRIPSGHGSVFR